MAKKCKIEKNKRQLELIARYRERRSELVAITKDPDATNEERLDAYRQISRMPRDASPVRYRNRCDLTGRPRGYHRKFRLCRVMLRDLALEGQVPGVKKSSW